MKKLINKFAVVLLSAISFAYISTASAEIRVGLGYTHAGFMGEGKEVLGTAAGETTVETGAFETNSPNIFVEFAPNDSIAIGIEHLTEDMTTPENTNLQNNANAGSDTNNTVKATFKEHNTVYVSVNLPYNFYAKAGYIMVDINTQESLATGGSYDDVDTTGYTIGLGYHHELDNGVFVRAELAAAEYDDVHAVNKAESAKSVSVSEMYGAMGSIKIGKSF